MGTCATPRLKLVSAALFSIAAISFASPALADELDTDASASFATPLGIVSAAPMAFGEVVRPNSGTCIYDMTPEGDLEATGGENCAVIAGVQLAAEFTLACEAGALINLTLITENIAPSGATFTTGNQPFSLDGAGAGADTMLGPCDADGESRVLAGGQLSVSSSAPSNFSGTVGRITLEAIYE